MGLHAQGVALGFQAVRRVEHPPGPHGPDPEEFDLPRMAVVDGGETFDIPALRGRVNSAGGTVFKLRGTYYLRVPDPSRMLSCSVDFLDFTLSLKFTVDGLG